MSETSKPDHKYEVGDEVFFGNDQYIIKYTSDNMRDSSGEPTYHLQCGQNDYHPTLRTNVRESELGDISLNRRIHHLEAMIEALVVPREDTDPHLTLEDIKKLPVGTWVECEQNILIAHTVFGWATVTKEGDWITRPIDAEGIMNYKPLKIWNETE